MFLMIDDTCVEHIVDLFTANVNRCMNGKYFEANKGDFHKSCRVRKEDSTKSYRSYKKALDRRIKACNFCEICAVEGIKKS